MTDINLEDAIVELYKIQNNAPKSWREQAAYWLEKVDIALRALPSVPTPDVSPPNENENPAALREERE